MSLRLPYCIIISLILVAGLISNFFIWESQLIGLTFGPAYLVFFSLMLGSIFFAKKSQIFKFLYGFLFLISGISFLGTLIYYFYQLNNFSIAALIVFIPLVVIIFFKNKTGIEVEHDFQPVQVSPHLLRTSFLVAAFIFLTILNLRFLINSGTTEAIRSPWKIIPFEFFLTYFGASAILLFFIFKSQKETLNLILTSVHTFLTVSLVLFIYKIGYGFDPFIHQATEKVIATQGFILPKPFYYLGQYSLVVFLAKIFQAPVEWIDKLLLPSLIAIFLPATIYFSLKPLTQKNQLPNASLLPLLILTLPFTSFIATTPQGLANFYLLTIIFLSILVLYREIPISYLWFLGFTTLFIHPLAGIPTLIFLSLLNLVVIFKKEKGFIEILRKITLAGSFILATVAIPLIFVFISFFLKDSAAAVLLKFPKELTLDWHLPVWFNHFQPIYDLIYTYGKNVPFILLTLCFVGYFLVRKRLPFSLIYISTFVVLIVNYVLVRFFINFSRIIQYEQQTFSQRILEMSFYFLIPLFLFALYKFFEKLAASSRLLKFFFILFFSLLITFSLYYSYPKDDGEDYHIDRGYSVSSSDITAVHAIAQDAGEKNYIVLANQMVGAAALREFGFKKYYGQNFYYSIPTGYPLYQYYLKMVYDEPSLAVIEEAADLTGVRLVYFVINKYWTEFDKIVEKAKKITDDWTVINEGALYIFKYQLLR